MYTVTSVTAVTDQRNFALTIFLTFFPFWILPSTNLTCLIFIHPRSKEHPGGAEIIFKYAGRDATSVFEPIHPPDALEKNLLLSKHMGPLTENAIQAVAEGQQAVTKTRDALRVEQARKKMPPLNRILNLQDMEVCNICLLFN